MDEQQDKRMERGNLSSTSKDGQGQNSFVLPDGREIINYKNPSTIITVGLVSFVLLIGSTTIIGYRAGRSEVTNLINENVPNVKLEENGPTLRRQIYNMESDINDSKKNSKRITDIECYLTKGKGIGCK